MIFRQIRRGLLLLVVLLCAGGCKPAPGKQRSEKKPDVEVSLFEPSFEGEGPTYYYTRQVATGGDLVSKEAAAALAFLDEGTWKSTGSAAISMLTNTGTLVIRHRGSPHCYTITGMTDADEVIISEGTCVSEARVSVNIDDKHPFLGLENAELAKLVLQAVMKHYPRGVAGIEAFRRLKEGSRTP